MKSKIHKLPLIFFIIVLSIFLYLLLIERNPSEVPSAFLNKNFPKFEAKSLFDKEKVISQNNLKDKIVLVNFFASWCKPCRDEHVYIKKISNNKKIKLIGINYKDSKTNALKWLKKYGNPYSEVAIDKNGKIAIDWGVYGIPETFIVDSKGIIKFRHVGPINDDIYKQIKFMIKNSK